MMSGAGCDALRLRKCPGNDPARVVRLHADMWVVCPRLGGRDQDEMRVSAGCLVGSLDQFAANATSLMRLIHRQVRQIRAIREVGYGTGNTDELPVDPRGGEHVRVLQ